MKPLCIIPCGSKKIWDINPNAGPTKAKDVYIGPFAKKCQQYAETFYSDSWCILSAKHGFLFPDDKVPGPYNVTFNKKATNPIGNEELIKQFQKKGMGQYKKVVVLGGKKYAEMANAVFANSEISTPLKGCKGMGYMMGKMNDAIKIKNLI
jgi:hypothetical protein